MSCRLLPLGLALWRDVVALAGYVHAASGRRYVLVAFINHPNAGAGRPALDALLDWAVRDN